MTNLTIPDTELRNILHIDKETRSGQYMCTCPLCGKPKHFYINKRTQVWDCKKCFAVGNIYKLLKLLGKLYLLGDKTVELTPQIKSIRESQDEEQNTDVLTTLQNLPVRKMPVGFKVCKNNAYLLSRGIGGDVCKRYGIGETNLVSKLKNYILIPIMDNGEVRGYLGRYGNKKVPENKLRYNNSLGTDFASLLYGYDDIVKGETETVIIVEGVFDMISVSRKLNLDSEPDIKCVCTFGKKISDNQIKKLLEKEVANIILCYDYDALKEIKSYGMELNMYFNTFAAVAMNKKDIDECTKEEAIEIIGSAVPIREFCTSVIGKLKR